MSSQLLKGLQRVRASVESAIGSFGGGEDSDEAGGSSSDGGSGSDEEGEWCLPWGEGKRSTEGEGAGQAVAAPSKQQVVLVEVDRRLFEQLSLVPSCAGDHIPDVYYGALRALHAEACLQAGKSNAGGGRSSSGHDYPQGALSQTSPGLLQVQQQQKQQQGAQQCVQLSRSMSKEAVVGGKSSHLEQRPLEMLPPVCVGQAQVKSAGHKQESSLPVESTQQQQQQHQQSQGKGPNSQHAAPPLHACTPRSENASEVVAGDERAQERGSSSIWKLWSQY